MYRLTFLLVIISVSALCEIVVIKKQKDRIYTGHVLFEVLMPMWSICAQYCSSVKVCQSINFIARNKTCQINDDEPGISNCEVLESVGNSLVMFSNFPENLAGNCNGNNCKLNEACMPNETGYYCALLPLKLSESSTQLRPRDCNDLPKGSPSGVYTIYPTDENFDVYCDMDTTGFGWTVFQSRVNGTVDFYNGWLDYETGFGNLKSEFWLGNKYINILTSSGNYKLLIYLEDFEGNWRYAEYSVFSIGNATTNYILNISGYCGTAGDSMGRANHGLHNGMMFSTKDMKNDYASSGPCGVLFKGAWWFNRCHNSNLNGEYLGGIHSTQGHGIVWKTWKGEYYSLKSSKMMIKRK
ncbi:Ryncolin-4,Angiopoietin-related protein 7,Angiopoietin-related protein 1,Ficolin-3,Ficolin-1-B,Techylectin-5A,Ficolin-2,Ryncolin-1,Tenascin-R,Fibrinogen-like protein 1,Angiopoietin-1,Fibrinogen C domain-containing protein 1-A,Ryncolin-3,Tenascin,Fibroleukin,Fibrinogen C domain-containing protein 1,Techylectin-like protein,Ryncolin-2,Techylectin-5B,Angiopoietin-related protein 2,Angiopoietin-2,Microfibril-associated glycoprotein 4,Ficolin-1-A,Ficolin-1,Fibrinogen C domain-containing protein 1-B,Angiopoietin|uniref:Fibrinogen C-terminal domain-containing protein n=1 Tax=Mytilus coruscus TaxID=42192 RepID=A0A6J8CYT4_MYTCO|nr:Ryncolin-4,Angiopoietin-related protein 7,Angiopoietin-related protein 1,Ficolin-3,Ficolin-1-B,Techylectin-5A,Ficolin-2,Ryncolin-1,Tenascin-R,Fibrinogen-like protein 1,Angiopoietin-1,Fibrinogen C domain-containing protein 1-A,Ryncolin-3,Tenascin,Fibroleukin,Fibrinogen C domain-containing protein 1,Techylectin-like protein,Ryncolin-2,Techylectin-5B,Angiopoietin-related protein 2,Angiopoietin-2,Microfibril-associated glycoprotein 4,Ficolin-1-A,Ficolin-1,Fibrinogen C domain-containing protein 1-B,A